MEAFCDAVVASKAPHRGDLLRPGSECFSQSNQLRYLRLAELIDGAKEPRGELLALLTRAMLLQKQVAQPLFEAIIASSTGLRAK